MTSGHPFVNKQMHLSISPCIYIYLYLYLYLYILRARLPRSRRGEGVVPREYIQTSIHKHAYTHICIHICNRIDRWISSYSVFVRTDPKNSTQERANTNRHRYIHIHARIDVYTYATAQIDRYNLTASLRGPPPKTRIISERRVVRIYTYIDAYTCIHAGACARARDITRVDAT